MKRPSPTQVLARIDAVGSITAQALRELEKLTEEMEKVRGRSTGYRLAAERADAARQHVRHALSILDIAYDDFSPL
jgi:hypothetical protein